MKEYNWRKEREKYRPDFRKETPGDTTVAPVVPTRNFIGTKQVLIIIFLIALIAGSLTWWGGCFGKNDSATELAKAAEKNKSAVGVVVLVVERTEGKKAIIPIGTAWAFTNNKFATNAHVAYGLKESAEKVKRFLAQSCLLEIAKENGCNSLEDFAKKLGEDKMRRLIPQIAAQAESLIRTVDVSIIINGNAKLSYPVKYVQIHKNYGVSDSAFNPDVAVLTIKGSHTSCFKLASKDCLHELKSGDPVAFLGFPTENLEQDNLNLESPIASMQSGIIVAVSDFALKDAGKEKNILIRHNLPATGGASGSPVFNKNGEAIALLYAVSMIGQVKNGRVERAPSAAQINFAVRADLLSEMGESIAMEDFLK